MTAATARRRAPAAKRKTARAGKPAHADKRTAATIRRQVREAIGIATDAAQFARALLTGETVRAKRQQAQLLRRLSRLQV